MKVFVLILQKPLKIKTYTSLIALIEDNNNLNVSKSTLQKWEFDKFDYISSKIIISKTYTRSTGDVRGNSLNSI